MKNNLVLKVVIGALIVVVAGLVVKLTMTNPKVQTNVAETTTTVTVPTTTVTLVSETTSTTKSSDTSCLDINKYAIPKQADTADVKIMQKALGVTPIGGNCGPKTQAALVDFRNTYGYNYGMGSAVCILSQEIVIAFNNKYCNQVINKTTWVNETPLAENALRTFFDLAGAKDYTNAQKYFWASTSNPTWVLWTYNANYFKEKNVIKFMYENGTMASSLKEVVKSEQIAPNTYRFTIRLIDKNGVTVQIGTCCGMTTEPGVDYTLTRIIVRKIGNQFLVADGFSVRS